MGRSLAEGFVFQGELSAYWNNAHRGEPCAGLPPAAFVDFLQNHDQVGNRALGERITAAARPEAARAAAAIYLLSPAPPMLFMGEEFAASTPFLFFCDFGHDLATAVTEGRRNEFARFEKFRDTQARCSIPDPNSVITFERSTLDWASIEDPFYKEWLDFYKKLLKLRRDHVLPLIEDSLCLKAGYKMLGERGLSAWWTALSGQRLQLLANLSDTDLESDREAGDVIYSSHSSPNDNLPPWSVFWTITS
jgi:1,4-alpha-glucan branching enzyme